ncbi:hypothetical protein H4J02_00635 [Protaetiibacter sp. SSC-01]|uniref:hypothetical protein n=1 Tax=Protaetiibacter sp. SSC-01 TaxID=2759943 RepID=UPI0016574CA0|nr:hypothetical protein [Protaetiibacter sp. SSC-01]QNO37594.1 hypothetical protein H4J02_00635 [Protaetiibacter sp. SSC-01]
MPSLLPLIAAVAAAALYAGIVAFQLALAAGVPWGRAAYGGQRDDLPASMRVSSGVAAVLWAGFALIVLRRVGLVGWAPLPDAWLPAAVWVAAALAGLSVVLNAITRSRIERAIWLPASVLLLAATLALALTAG